jgi:hypothetical protein
MAETHRRPPPPPRSTKTGISFDVLVPGAFYQGVYPGGFSDSLTGIHIPGPKAILDGSTKRSVVRLTDLPEPVQLPHYKIVVEVSDSGKTRKEVESDFNANDEQPVHDAFQLGLATGVIRMVPDDEMEEKYPETWAERQERYVWRQHDVTKVVDMAAMLREAQENDDFARFANETTAQTRERVEAIDTPRRPPPPPKK